MIRAFGEIGKAIESGSCHYQYVNKPTIATTGVAGQFYDLNQVSGVPRYNAFVGSQATFTPLNGSGNSGIYVGTFETGKTKHLARFQVHNPNVSGVLNDQVYLNDYLGFYPLIDCDSVDLQEMDNTLSLPRYTDGKGVRIVLIVQAPTTNIADLTINFVDDTNTERSITRTICTGSVIGSCVATAGLTGATTSSTIFWPLANGSLGVKSIKSVQFASAAGGFICLALVKPLADIHMYEANVASEKIYGINNIMPVEILPNAYLNLMLLRTGTANATLRAELLFINT